MTKKSVLYCVLLCYLTRVFFRMVVAVLYSLPAKIRKEWQPFGIGSWIMYLFMAVNSFLSTDARNWFLVVSMISLVEFAVEMLHLPLWKCTFDDVEQVARLCCCRCPVHRLSERAMNCSVAVAYFHWICHWTELAEWKAMDWERLTLFFSLQTATRTATWFTSGKRTTASNSSATSNCPSSISFPVPIVMQRYHASKVNLFIVIHPINQ